MSAFTDEIKEAMREVLREELPRALARMAPDRLVSIKEAAGRLGIAVSTLHHRLGAGEIGCVKDGGRTFFRVRDLDAYVERRVRSGLTG